MIRKLIHRLLRRYYHGVTEADFDKLNGLTDQEYRRYCFRGRDVYDNPVFKNEITRLRKAQESFIAKDAKNMEQLVAGRESLRVLDLIEKRFRQFKDRADDYNEVDEEESGAHLS